MNAPIVSTTQIDLAKEAHRLTADLSRASKVIYWTDLGLTVAVTYASVFLAASTTGWPMAAAALVAILALYRGISFIHELAHARDKDVPGFSFAWNLTIGVPFLAPSLLYEGVHNLHHAKHRYGTAEDPEYLPLAHGPVRDLVLFVAIALLAPLGTFLRFAISTPLSLLIPSLRPVVIARFSAMVINPGFRRPDPERAKTAGWKAQEIACWLWSWALVAIVVNGGFGAKLVATGVVIYALTTFLNQLRTLVAHAWTNEGERMSFEAQFADTVNVPPPALLPMLWAPVGLRYHALHHLLPRLPYHALGEAHRRMVALGPVYRQVEHPSLFAAVSRIVGHSLSRARP